MATTVASERQWGKCFVTSAQTHFSAHLCSNHTAPIRSFEGNTWTVNKSNINNCKENTTVTGNCKRNALKWFVTPGSIIFRRLLTLSSLQVIVSSTLCLGQGYLIKARNIFWWWQLKWQLYDDSGMTFMWRHSLLIMFYVYTMTVATIKGFFFWLCKSLLCINMHLVMDILTRNLTNYNFTAYEMDLNIIMNCLQHFFLMKPE